MAAIDEKKHDVGLDESQSILKVRIYGYFQPEDLQFLANKYYSVIEKIDTAAYELYFETKDLRVTFFDLEGLLAACFEMFKKDGYKKITVDGGSKEVMILRIKNIAEKSGLDNIEFVQ